MIETKHFYLTEHFIKNELKLNDICIHNILFVNKNNK